MQDTCGVSVQDILLNNNRQEGSTYIHVHIDIQAYHRGIKYVCTKGALSSTTLALCDIFTYYNQKRECFLELQQQLIYK